MSNLGTPVNSPSRDMEENEIVHVHDHNQEHQI